MSKDSLTPRQRLGMQLSDLDATCRTWAGIEGRLTDKERREKEEVFERRHKLEVRISKLK